MKGLRSWKLGVDPDPLVGTKLPLGEKARVSSSHILISAHCRPKRDDWRLEDYTKNTKDNSRRDVGENGIGHALDNIQR